MPEVGSASLAIIPSFDGFQSKIEGGTGKAMAASGASGGAKFGDAAGKSTTSRFGTHVKKAAKVAALGLAAAGAVAFKFAGDALEEAREAQKIGAQTEAVIKSTGKAANLSATQVGKLSGRLSDMAGIDDEIIQNGANVLLTFTKIRNEVGKGNKIFDRGTKAALNMSVALGQDLGSASILVGKALNDPVKGVTALARAGVQMTTQQRAQIQALVEGGDANAAVATGLLESQKDFSTLLKVNDGDILKTVETLTNHLTPAQKKTYEMYAEGGHTLEAQKRILKELDTQFAGSAKAQATDADKLQVAWGNFKEEIGTELLPMMDDLSTFLRKKGIPAAQDFIGWVRDEGVPAVKDWADKLTPVVDGAKDLAKFLNDIPAPTKIAAVTTMFAAIAGAKLRGGALGNGGLLGNIGKAVGMAKPLPVFVTNMGAGTGLPVGPTGPGPTPTKPGPMSKPAKAASFASKAFWPTAAIVTSAVALNDLFKWNHEGDTGLGFASGGKLGDIARGIANAGDEASDTKARLDNVENAADKVERQLGDTKNAGEKLRDVLFEIDRSDPRVTYTAPGFDELLRKTHEYYGLLDGLPRRVVTEFVQNITRNNDTGEGGGGIVPGRSPQGGVTVHVDRVEAHNYRDFMDQLQRRTRGQALDGVR